MTFDAPPTSAELAYARQDRPAVVARGRVLRRRRRLGAEGVAASVIVAAVAAVLVLAGGGRGTRVTTTGSTALTGPARQGWIYLRPVDCFLAAASPDATVGTAVDTTTCLAPASLQATTSPSGDDSATSVVLPGAVGRDRYVLGPSDADQSSIEVATVRRSGGGCVVTLTVSNSGVALLDRLAAARNRYYQPSPGAPQPLEAVDVDGEVPTLITFALPTSGTSLRLPTSGVLVCSEARRIAAAAAAPSPPAPRPAAGAA